MRFTIVHPTLSFFYLIIFSPKIHSLETCQNVGHQDGAVARSPVMPGEPEALEDISPVSPPAGRPRVQLDTPIGKCKMMH